MKPNTIKKLLAISTMAIALPFASLSHADAGKHCERHGNKSSHHASMTQNGVPPHFRALNLTQDQQDKIFTIMHEQAPAKYALRKQQRENHEAMRLLSQADTFDEARAQQLTDQLARFEKEKAMNHLQTQAKITALLTFEQRQKAREFKMQHGRHGMEKPARFQRHNAPVVKPVNG